MKKTKRIWSMVLTVVMVCGVMFTNVATIHAATKKVRTDQPGLFAYDGKNIYYTATDYSGWGLNKLDPKTKKSTTVVDWKKFNNRTLAELTIKGDYIYFLANTSKDRYGCYYELHRVKKNGSGLKSLKVLTDDFVIVGKNIYYVENKIDKESIGEEGMDAEGYLPTGRIMKMNLDGSGKKVVKKYSTRDHQYTLAVYNGKAIYGDKYGAWNYKTLGGGTSIRIDKVAKLGTDRQDIDPISECDVYVNGYKYYRNDDGSLCRMKNGSEKEEVIVNESKRGKTHRFRVCGDYIIGQGWSGLDYVIFCVKTDGKEYKVLHRRVAAG